MLLVSNRILPASGMHHVSRIVLGIPKQGSMRGGAYPLTTAQKAMVFTAKVLPQPLLKGIAALATRFNRASAEKE